MGGELSPSWVAAGVGGEPIPPKCGGGHSLDGGGAQV